MQIQEEEQQQLVTHRRAITEVLPEEMSATAVGQNKVVNFETPALSGKIVAFPGREVVISDAAPISQDVHNQGVQASFSSSPTLDNSIEV